MKQFQQLSAMVLCLILLTLSFASCIETETSKTGTDGLDYYPLPDGTWGVSMGKTQFLEEVVIPTTHEGEKVTQILLNGFQNAVNLKRVQIQSSITAIGAGAFSGCTSLTEMVIPSTVTSIGEGALNGCTGLTDLTLPFLGASLDDTTKNSTLAYLFGEKLPSSLATVTLAGGTVIGNGAFKDCELLETVNLPEGITSIGPNAFYNCIKLKRITLPSSVTHINTCAFYNCESLEEIHISGGVTGIGSETFKNCKSLTTLVLPNSVNAIYFNAFEGCKSLTGIVLPKLFSVPYGNKLNLRSNGTLIRTIYYYGTKADWEKIQDKLFISTNTTVYFYSEERPTSSDPHWHFVSDQIPAPW